MQLLQHVCEWRGLARANFVFAERPDRFPRAVLAALPYGRSVLGGVSAARARYPHAVALDCPQGRLTYTELWNSSVALTAGLRQRGAGAGSRIGVLCHNGPLFVQSLLAGTMLGADIVLLNTAMAPAQLADVIRAEALDIVLHDNDLAEGVAQFPGVSVSEAWCARLIAANHGASFPAPRRESRLVVLTSGTTGRPKGAIRPSGGGAANVGGLLDRIPLRARDTVVLPAPFFHAWGLGMLLIALSLCCTVVAHPDFGAEAVLAQLDDHDADVLVAVPAMLQRICDHATVAGRERTGRDLRVIASGGSALPPRVVAEVLARFGPVLYNVYGSTEVSAATVATPMELAANPGCAGRALPGVRVVVVDDRGNPVPRGEVGRILVGTEAAFLGYTGTEDSAPAAGPVPTGDLGHVDDCSRLFIDGREDDMIVSGGENVYPVEVEDLLSLHEAVAEVIVVGVPDDRFGQALKAYVVLKPGHQIEPETLRAYVREQLARFKVPREIVFVEEFPRTATGKVIRRSLS